MKYLTLLFLFSCSHLFYYPSKEQKLDSHQFIKKVEDLNLTTEDGIKIHAQFFHAEKSPLKGTILFFHGNAENISTHFLNLAWVTKHGFNLMVFDYRGYGKSEGTPSQKGTHLDSLKALNVAFERHTGLSPKGKFIVYGSSLGGVISLRAIENWDKRNHIDLIVQDSTFMSYQKIAFEKLKSSWLTYLISPLAYVLVSDEYESSERLKEIENPLLVILQPHDPVVPARLTEEIYLKSRSQKKWLWESPRGAHTDIFWVDQYRNRERFLDLIDNL